MYCGIENGPWPGGVLLQGPLPVVRKIHPAVRGELALRAQKNLLTGTGSRQGQK